MAKDRSLVRASDIGVWAYCRRAWWLANVQHAPHENPSVLQRGTAAHAEHGGVVLASQRLQRAGTILLVAGVLLLAFIAVFWFAAR